MQLGRPQLTTEMRKDEREEGRPKESERGDRRSEEDKHPPQPLNNSDGSPLHNGEPNDDDDDGAASECTADIVNID